MKILRPASYRVVPWKNGGGVTTELYVSPEDAGPEGKEFHWRVSIAEVARDGPFSRFGGYDRHIMLIDGNGMVLDGGPDGPIDLSRRYEPQSFSGDWNVTGRLIGGPVRDFNLMTRRVECVGRLRVQSVDRAEPVESGSATVLIYILAGDLDCDAGELHQNHSLLMLPGEMTKLEPKGGKVQMAVCEISQDTL